MIDKHPHIFEIVPNKDKYWPRPSYYARCIKCEWEVCLNQKHGFISMNVLNRKDDVDWKKDLKEQRRGLAKDFLSLGYYKSLNNVVYRKDNVIIEINHKYQMIKKTYCTISNDDFLVRDIIQ